MAAEIVEIKESPYWYKAKDILGEGSFGKVYKGRDKRNRKLRLAIKKIKNIKQGQEKDHKIDREITILQGLSTLENAHIVSLIAVVKTDYWVYLVTEYCNGGDLNKYLKDKEKMDEPSLKIFLQQIASALTILRENDIIHRDLKPDNILLNYKNFNITFKIADFGLGRFLDANAKTETYCGTEGYMAPEMLKLERTYDYKVDLYSIGVIVHQCFTGRFVKNPLQKLSANMGKEMRDLISRLLCKDPTERIDFDDFYNHPFIGMTKPKSTVNYAIFLGFDDGSTVTKDVIKINLCRPYEISSKVQIPTTMKVETYAAVFGNAMYVVGIGDKRDEIWKYNATSGWIRCASLVQGRRRHSATFINGVLYICGGYVGSSKSVLKCVEAYDTVNDKCKPVGSLFHCVDSSGNCVPFKNSIYIFGGCDKDGNKLSDVQVYNTDTNTCSVLSQPMSQPHSLMRAVLWEKSVILLGWETCLIFNFEAETWKERKHFKTNVAYFGLVLDNELLFVIGGGMNETDKDGKIIWKRRDDVRYVPLQNIMDDSPIEWKIHATLPKPTLVQAFCKVLY